MRRSMPRLGLLPGLGLLVALATVTPAIVTPVLAEDTTEASGASSGASGRDISAWDQIEGNWVEFKGLLKEQWGELTDDDLLQIQGEREQLVGRIQTLYGISLEDAESQVSAWENRVVAP